MAKKGLATFSYLLHLPFSQKIFASIMDDKSSYDCHLISFTNLSFLKKLLRFLTKRSFGSFFCFIYLLFYFFFAYIYALMMRSTQGTSLVGVSRIVEVFNIMFFSVLKMYSHRCNFLKSIPYFNDTIV